MSWDYGYGYCCFFGNREKIDRPSELERKKSHLHTRQRRARSIFVAFYRRTNLDESINAIFLTSQYCCFFGNREKIDRPSELERKKSHLHTRQRRARSIFVAFYRRTNLDESINAIFLTSQVRVP